MWVWRLRQGVTHLSTTAKPLNKILACRLKTIYPCAASGSASASPSFTLFLLLTLPPSLSLCCPSHIDGIYYIYVCITFALIILSSCCCCNLCICSSALTANWAPFLSSYLSPSPILQAASSSWKLHLATSYVLMLLLLAFVKCQRIVGIISGYALCSVSSFHANFQIFLHFNYQHQHQARNLHPQCTRLDGGWRKGVLGKGQSFASFPRWRNWLHLLSVLSVLCQRILHLSSTDADDDPICLSNDATCCATVRPTCNMQRATCNDLKSLLEAFNACCCNCNRFSASLLPTNSLASFAWFSVCNEMRNLLPVCSCLFAVPLAHLPLSTSFCLPLSSFFPHHRSSYCRLHCNCNCRTQHSVPRSQFNILSLFSFVSARSLCLSLASTKLIR